MLHMNEYQKELLRLLNLSTLTPSSYRPSRAVKAATHAAVFVGARALLLTGPSDDLESMTQARSLALSQTLRIALGALGLHGAPEYGTVRGCDIDWQDSHPCVSSSKSGHTERGNEAGDVMTIVLGDSSYEGLTVVLCTVSELARIIDPNAPEMDDGRRLSELARKCA